MQERGHAARGAESATFCTFGRAFTRERAPKGSSGTGASASRTSKSRPDAGAALRIIFIANIVASSLRCAKNCNSLRGKRRDHAPYWPLYDRVLKPYALS